MRGEADFQGLFVVWPLLWALVALAVGAVLRRVLARAGAYRFVWHPALFDLAGFVILWGGVCALAEHVRGF